jgi:phage baseplate assembly protein W
MKSIKIPFSFSGGKTQVTTSLSTIAEQKIIDLLTTNKYSRVMMHRYGSGVNRFLFEPVDDLSITDFTTDVRQDARSYLSRVEILDIRVTNPDRMISYTSPETSLGITVIYRLPMGSPQLVKFKVAIPGNLEEDSLI